MKFQKFMSIIMGSIAFFAIFLTSTLVAFFFNSHISAEFKNSADVHVQREAINLEEYLSIYEYPEIVKRYSMNLGIPNLVYIGVYDDTNRIIVERSKDEYSSLVSHRDKLEFDRKIFDSKNPQRYIGSLKMVFDTGVISGLFIRGVIVILALGLIITILTVVAVVKIIHRFTEPLFQIAEKMRNYNTKREKMEKDLLKTKIYEFQVLNSAFIDMHMAIAKHQAEAQLNARMASIGQSTAMLAHDVRKPFSMINAMLEDMDRYKNDEESLNSAKTAIKKSIKKVETMVNDIMDLSREVRLEVKPALLSQVLDYSIREAAQNIKGLDIGFIYSFKHTLKPMFDEERIARVFVNILSNAFEAIQHIGRKNDGIVWFDTIDILVSERPFVRIVIGNSGPLIDDRDMGNLFESFFSKGKRKGTGIGLASAQKIVNLHEGNIYAKNREDMNGVEFFIELPVSSEQIMEDSSILPNRLKEALFVDLKQDEIEVDGKIRKLSVRDGKFKVLLLEDEALYRASVRNTVKRNFELDKLITLYDAHTVEEAIKLLEAEAISHAIVDIDLGQLTNGFDFLDMVKKRYPKLRSMVHTNRCIDEDKQKAFKLGALSFVPKPLSIEHLVDFLSMTTVGEPRKKEIAPKRILLVNDERHMLKIISNMLESGEGNLNVLTAENFHEAIEILEKERIDIVFSDLNLNEDMDGFDVLSNARQMQPKAKLYMVSGTPSSHVEERIEASQIDGYIEHPIEKKDFEGLLLK